MKATRFSRAFGICLLGLLLVSSTSLALADPPTHVEIPINLTFMRIDLTASCGFTVSQTNIGTISESVFTNRNGGVTRVLDAYHVTADYFFANGHTVNVSNASGPGHMVFNPDGSYTLYILGTYDFTTYPSQGVIQGSAGQTILTFSADNQLLSTEIRGRTVSDLSAFCAALAP